VAGEVLFLCASPFRGLIVSRGASLTTSAERDCWAEYYHSATQELDLKVRQFNKLLKGPPALSDAPNINMLWAHLMVDELCRLGASTFCIAPGVQAGFLIHS